VFTRWRQQARRLKALTYSLYIAYRDERTPWYARVLAACVLGYAFSPIDLIPDMIPVLGYLDDLVLVPLGIALTVRLLPREVWRDAQAQSTEMLRANRPTNRLAAALIVLVWLVTAVAGVLLVRRWL
jgi:uncharacterized membrane protein YkvA (DUF1232 family)